MSESRRVGLKDESERERARRYISVRVTENERGCWVWNGYKLHFGHGQAKWAKYPRKAHRLAYAAFVGEPGELGVLHKCDNPPCCNPGHLFLGTKGDNNRDAHTKGRYSLRRQPPDRKIRRGTEHPCAKLSPLSILLALELMDAGMRIPQIAAALDVNSETLARVFRRMKWGGADLCKVIETARGERGSILRGEMEYA